MAFVSVQANVVGGGLFGWGEAKKPELAKVLCENSGANVEWLTDKFNLDLSLLHSLLVIQLPALTVVRNVSQL